MARRRRVAVLALGAASAFSPSTPLLPRQTALRAAEAAEAPEDAATPAEEGPDAATVAAGEQAVISVSGSSGDGTLTIETDDAANPTLTVALSAVQNQPPTVTIADHGDVVPPGGRATFTASVTDDDPDGVTLVWRSSEDGELGTGDTLQWDGPARTEGAHTVIVTATDACGAVASDETSVCQNAGYTEETLDLETWTFSGRAHWDADNGWVELTDTTRRRAPRRQVDVELQ